jgi:hypothetical protein
MEDFRTDIEAVTETKPEERKSNAGRKPYDTILKFKIMVLQSLHNLSVHLARPLAIVISNGKATER